MESYTAFAEVYDLYMDNAPYDTWAENLKRLLSEYLKQTRVTTEVPLVAELGCGTGEITKRLSGDYDMIGIDNSGEMLMIAREKSPEVLWLQQDMRELELFGTVAAVISVCDSMNYLLTEEDLLETLKKTENYLDPGGVLIFDMNTLHKYRDILSDNTFAENREEGSFIWENEFDPDTLENVYDLTLYIAEGEAFRRYEETHVQRAFPEETVIRLIKEAGLEPVAVLDTETLREPEADAERIYFIAREKKKEKE